MSNIPIQVRMSADKVSALDNYRRTMPNPPSRARALRELACGALDKLQHTDASSVHGEIASDVAA
jgi:hypothetical protein